MLARLELVQRWPTRTELSAAEQNRAEMFSRSYEDEGDGFMLAERRNSELAAKSTLQASRSLSSMPNPPPAPKPPLARSRAYASEADLSKFLKSNDEGPVSFGPGVALMLVDIQPVYWSLAPEVQAAFPAFPANVSHLLASARGAGSHIIHVKASYSYDTCPWLKNFQRLNPGRRMYEIDPSEVEEFAQPREGETIVDKDTFGAFIHAPDLAVRLREAGVNTIVFAGLITSVCVQHSVFGAFNAGFRVVVAHDACGDRSRARHEAALMLYGNYMYDVASTGELLKETEKAKEREEVEASYKSTTAPALTQRPPRPLAIANPTALLESNFADFNSKRYFVASKCGRSPVSNLGVSLSQISLVDYVNGKRSVSDGLSPVCALDLDNASL
jgi:maleamate amidohydrolase